MLRLARTLFVAVSATALLAAMPASAQGAGLDSRIAEAGTKLDSDIQGCKPIDLGEYSRLLNEAGQNKLRADKMAKKGLPVNQAQVDADLANASALFNRAQAALVQQCIRGAEQPAQPQPQSVGAVPGGGIPGQAAQGAPPGGFSDQLAQAQARLEADIAACRPINPDDYKALHDQAVANLKVASKAFKSGAPVDIQKVSADGARAADLWQKAQKAQQDQKKACPPKTEPQTQPPPKPVNAVPGGATAPLQCPGGPPAQVKPDDVSEQGQRVPTKDEIERRGNDMVEAYEKGRHSEAEYLRGTLDQEAEHLNQIIQDARPLGDMANFDVKAAEARLKQINDLRRYADKIGIRPCDPNPIPSLQQPQPQPPADVPKQGAMNLSPFAKEILAVHNAARAAYGVPPLEWSEELVAGAADYVQNLLRTGQMVHASREGRGKVRENISQGLPGWSTAQLLESWTKEKAKFKPGKFPYVSNTGNWYEVGHWSQMIWANTMLIGCAQATGAVASWLVCRYDPGGNRDGEEVGIPPSHDIAQPELPKTEVFKGKPGPAISAAEAERMFPAPGIDHYSDRIDKTVERDRNASMFDIGIYAGGAWTTDWFTAEGLMADDDEFWGASAGLIARLSEDTRLELGAGYDNYDMPSAGFGNGIYWDPLYQVTIGGGASYVDIPPFDFSESPRCVDTEYKDAVDAVANYTSANMKGDRVGMDKAKADFAAAIDAQRKLAAGDAMEAKILEIMIQTYTDITGEKPPAETTPEVDTPTDVEQPGLPTKEVFNPADLPKCTLEIM